jgi:hypothetical protein
MGQIPVLRKPLRTFFFAFSKNRSEHIHKIFLSGFPTCNLDVLHCTASYAQKRTRRMTEECVECEQEISTDYVVLFGKFKRFSLEMATMGIHQTQH